jgi:hypothetical protein
VSAICKRLHELVYQLPEISWPFTPDQLPHNGIYFFNEKGETWGHGGDQPRIVRVGTHREGNFRSRMADHYILNERKMAFDKNQASPKDRSIFRKNIGRALLHGDADPYELLWEIDFTTRYSRETNGSRRDVEKEREIERAVTRILRERFTFRWIDWKVKIAGWAPKAWKPHSSGLSQTAKSVALRPLGWAALPPK